MTESTVTAADWDHKYHGNTQPKSACEIPRPRYNFQGNSTRASTADEIWRQNLSFPRETGLYTDAKILKARLIGTAPINKKNIHCDWSTTRDRADSWDAHQNVVDMLKKAYDITWLSCFITVCKTQTSNNSTLNWLYSCARCRMVRV